MDGMRWDAKGCRNGRRGRGDEDELTNCDRKREGSGGDGEDDNVFDAVIVSMRDMEMGI